jgi:hypothetical protein
VPVEVVMIETSPEQVLWTGWICCAVVSGTWLASYKWVPSASSSKEFALFLLNVDTQLQHLLGCDLNIQKWTSSRCVRLKL